MVATGEPLVRLTGGFWTLPTIPRRTRTSGGATYEVPDWWVLVGTVKAMDARAWLVRACRLPEAWQDDRLLTDAGRAALARLEA
jgi:hypothetical protein